MVIFSYRTSRPDYCAKCVVSLLIFLQSIKPIHTTKYEWESMQLKILEPTSTPNEKLDKFKTLFTNIELKQFEDGMDDWVTTVENLIPVLEVGLNICECRDG